MLANGQGNILSHGGDVTAAPLADLADELSA
jgi:hypothetical protein